LEGRSRRIAVLAALAMPLAGVLGADNCSGNSIRPAVLQPGPTPPACGASLTWQQGVAPAGGIQRYDVYRNGRKVGESPVALRIFVDGAFLVAGSVYGYEVRTVGNDGVVYAPGSSIQLTPVNCPPIPDAALQVEVFQVGFSDVSIPQSAAAVEDLVFGPTESVAAYWSEVSFGRQILTGSVRALSLSAPIGSYCATQVEPAVWIGCDTARIKADLVAAVGSQVNWWDVERAVLVVYGYRWRGSAGLLTTYAGDVSDVIIGGEAGIDSADTTTIVHELGHTGGANHASVIRDCGGGFPPDPQDPGSGGCTIVKYGDPWDPMGVGSVVDDVTPGVTGQHFGAYHKEQLGFLESQRIPRGHLLRRSPLDPAYRPEHGLRRSPDRAPDPPL
jgi:hypothetical protein